MPFALEQRRRRRRTEPSQTMNLGPPGAAPDGGRSCRAPVDGADDARGSPPATRARSRRVRRVSPGPLDRGQCSAVLANAEMFAISHADAAQSWSQSPPELMP